MKKLFFVRHGETDLNVSVRFAGTTEAQLTENGKGQAKRAGQLLKSSHPKVDLILCSPLARTVHTATLIAKELGYDETKIETHEIFIERNFGVLEGTDSTAYFKNHQPEDVDKEDGAETIEQMHTRAQKALEYIKSRPENNILLVSHGSFGRTLRRVVKSEPHTDEYNKPIERIGNAEIIELI